MYDKGVAVFDGHLNALRSISSNIMRVVYDVAVLPNGDVVFAASTGLYVCTPEGILPFYSHQTLKTYHNIYKFTRHL